MLLAASGLAAAQSKPIEICKGNRVGHRLPTLHSPQDAADALRRKANFTPWWIYRKTLAILFTPLKSVGFFGWTDYCSEACGAGKVVHAVSGIDGMYTVDLALREFSVNGEPTQLDGHRFIRVEFRSRVKKKTRPLPRKGDAVRICGKLMGDGHGFLEIHPRSPADIEINTARPNIAVAP